MKGVAAAGFVASSGEAGMPAGPHRMIIRFAVTRQSVYRVGRVLLLE